MPDNAAADVTVGFLGYRHPALDGGDYEIRVEQTTSLQGEAFTTTRTFTVAGERFTLAPNAIRATYPPEGSLGDCAGVLPHIILDRPTLPWERDPTAAGEAPPSGPRPPWLAVLLFTEDERPEPRTVTLNELATGPGTMPAPVLERHQSPTDPVTVIDIDPALLHDLLPGWDELSYLAHVRTGAGPDAAVVLGARLPSAGSSCTAHLVSLEGRFRVTSAGTREFFVDGSALVRLVSLTSWRFASADPAQTFAGLTSALATGGGAFRLPDSHNPVADKYLRQGFVPIRQQLRDGSRTVCWYRGPLVTGPTADNDASVPPVRAADPLLRFHPQIGMFDVGYAAAWQLGRLLTLRSTNIATQLWQHRRRRGQGSPLTALEQDNYPFAVTAIDNTLTLPDTVLDWLRDLAALRGVPFGYLVPDERLLPVETVRFVAIDQRWVQHLLDGAYSLGRLSQADADADAAHPLPITVPTRTGALIRSELIAGYPSLIVKAYSAQDTPLDAIRMERLSSTILLCLFDGVLARLDLQQQPGTQHFAVEPTTSGQFTKSLRVPGTTPTVGPLPLGPRGTLPITELTRKIADALHITGPLSVADFAAQMIETADRITFTARPAS
ncbi:MAG: hypothetical protein WCF33_01055 [Pseudonocardiaceae bacterium]